MRRVAFARRALAALAPSRPPRPHRPWVALAARGETPPSSLIAPSLPHEWRCSSRIRPQNAPHTRGFAAAASASRDGGDGDGDDAKTPPKPARPFAGWIPWGGYSKVATRAEDDLYDAEGESEWWSRPRRASENAPEQRDRAYTSSSPLRAALLGAKKWNALLDVIANAATKGRREYADADASSTIAIEPKDVAIATSRLYRLLRAIVPAAKGAEILRARVLGDVYQREERTREERARRRRRRGGGAAPPPREWRPPDLARIDARWLALRDLVRDAASAFNAQETCSVTRALGELERFERDAGNLSGVFDGVFAPVPVDVGAVSSSATLSGDGEKGAPPKLAKPCADGIARSHQVRSIQTFFTHPSVSTFDRVPFQLTDELFLYGMALSAGAAREAARGGRRARVRRRARGRCEGGDQRQAAHHADHRVAEVEARPNRDRRAERRHVAFHRAARARRGERRGDARAGAVERRRRVEGRRAEHGAVAARVVWAISRGGRAHGWRRPGDRGASRGEPRARAATSRRARRRRAVRLLPIRPRSRCERRSLRTFPVVALHPRFPFNVRLTGKTFD
ncbi:uncharacterized protein MICPUCDRAFT_63787 [Micromonas pusilla CCMP1545]|uniref:Predicted protein n=1 Tax=Micromonas pusilla (strain CCMP1545) TaxID=564608 RepID=C1N5W0_MICPC|nr:uncharacterized protein MICPUCDRAFT_63787 [Micromonas pusilla CCMP1545]EEH52570.1 predicted protein [Micromonas pusilla CCMP1545]|eukprot:XP_003063434.1 predicted protein [Micromonas pusilla CCMP1545]